MNKLLLLISLALTAISSNLVAEEIVVQAEGNAMKTAGIANHVYEARAIADALQSVVQSGAQSLGSFSLVENGQVVFDQISAQSNIKIAGYRVLSIKEHADNISARLEVLLITADSKKSLPTCRQPTNLDVAFKWQGVSTNAMLPFWVQIDEQSIKSEITKQINASGKYNISQKDSARVGDQSNYSLYETTSATGVYIPNYTITLNIDLDIVDKSSLLLQSKTLVVKAQSDLIRRSQPIESTKTQANFKLQTTLLTNSIGSGRKDLEKFQQGIAELAQLSVAKTLEKLECKNFSSKIKYKNGSLQIDYGFQDGLLETEIFSTYGTGTKQYYFTVKEMSNNSTTLHALSQNSNVKLYDGLNIQLLERF